MLWLSMLLGLGCDRQPAEPAAILRGHLELVSREHVRLGLTIRDGWHIGSNLPGRGGGFPTRVAWTLPEGWRVADERWPSASPVALGGDTVAVFSGAMVIDVVLAPSAATRSEPIVAVVTYGACRDQCVAGRLALSVDP